MPDGARGTIIFDLDGTLVDSAPDLADALDTLLGERGLAPIGLGDTRQLIGHGIEELVRKGLAERGVEPSTAEQAEATERFLEIYTSHLSRKTRPYPGALDTLTELRRDRWRLVICTNKFEAHARDILFDLNLLPFFSLIAGPDTFGVAKPDPKHLLCCLAQPSDHGHGAVMVGDSHVDVAAARSAAIPVIAVSWGYAKVPVRDLGSDGVADNFDEVPPLIRQLAAS